MRRRWRHLLMLLASGALVAAAAEHLLSSGRDKVASPHASESARARNAIELQSGQWTVFRIPSNATRLKLLTRAYMHGRTSLIDREFPYRVEYQLESRAGVLVSSGEFLHAARFTQMVDSHGRPQRAAALAQSSIIAAAAKPATLDLPDGEVLTLRLRVPPPTPPVAEVTVRAFVREDIAGRKLNYLWNRISHDTRERLALQRLHGLADLTTAERRAALANRWLPIGPQGVAGDDFVESTVYLRDDLVPARRELIEPLGVGEIRCGPGRRAVVPVPSPGGRVRLAVRSLDASAGGVAKVRFFGEALHQRWAGGFPVTGSDCEFTGEFETGMLEIECDAALAIRPFLTPAPGAHPHSDPPLEQPIDLDPTVVRAWSVAPGQPVEFRFGGDLSEPRYFRASARPGAGAAAALSYELVDQAGNTVRHSEADIAAQPSLYDVALTPEGDVVVNDPVDVVLRIPAGIEKVVLRARSAILVSGYTRPSGLRHVTRVPADYQRALPDPGRLPVWFGLRPVAADALIRAHRSHLIHLQTRPPEDDADILAGHYQWEDFQPTDGALGQFLLTDRDPRSPSRDEALPSLFMPVAVGEPRPLALKRPPGFEAPSPRLAFVRDGTAPEPLWVFVDGIRVLDRTLVTDRGELMLPPIPPDSQDIQIECAARGLRCFVNFADPRHATKLKRMAQRIERGTTLRYTCTKTTADDELLTGMLFAPAGHRGEARIDVEIRAGGVRDTATSLTPRQRTYFITPDASARTPVLGGSIPWAGGGRRFFIPLGSDLLPGDYEVTVTLRDGTAGFLTLSKVTGGDYADARFFREASR